MAKKKDDYPKREVGNPNWIKGVSGNPNGRPIGTRNKTPAELKHFLTLLLQNRFEKLERDLDKLTEVQQWNILEKFAKYVFPTKTENETSGNITVQVVHGKDVEEEENENSDDMNEYRTEY